MIMCMGPSIKYISSKGEGRGQGKRLHLLFLWHHSIVLKCTRGEGMSENYQMWVHTWWMAPIICMLNKTSFVEHMLQCWLHMIINIFLTLTLLIMHFMIFQLYHIDVVNMDMYKYALFSLTQCQLTSRYISSMCVATSCQLFSPFTMILTSFS